MEKLSDLAASGRAAALADPGTLAELDGAQRGTLWAGTAKIAGRSVALAINDGHVRGGTIGIEEANAFAQLVAVAEAKRWPIVIHWDTGGVRVHEGSAALASASAVGVGLTRLALLGLPVVSVIGAPRGCFGAPAVIAATSHVLVMLENAHWGLTGPELLELGHEPAAPAAGREATSAAHRIAAGQVDSVVEDSPSAVRATLARALAARRRRLSAKGVLATCVARTEALVAKLDAQQRALGLEERSMPVGRRRDFFRYSLRGSWRPLGPEERRGQIHAALGEFEGRAALAIIVGADRSQRGIGIEDAHTVTRLIQLAFTRSAGERMPIVTFLFCRGHANDLAEERAGLASALAECLRSFVVARLAGHPLVCVLGGGAYGAAYLSLAAPSHRVLAIRGTTVAPMAPRVLAAFRRLRGIREAAETPDDLARLIPSIRIVESVMRLPRALADELAAARGAVRAEIPASGRLVVPDAWGADPDW